MKGRGNGRAWRAGIGVAVMAVCALMPIIGFSLFLQPLSTGLEVSVGEISLIMSIETIGSLVTSLLFGKLLQKFNPKALIVIAGVFVMVFMVSMALAQSVFVLYATSLLLGVGTVLGGFPMAQTIISMWFEKARGTMMSVCSVGLAVAAMILIPTLGVIIADIGYTNVALVFGIVLGVLMVLMGLFMVSGAPARYGMVPYGFVATSETGGGTAVAEMPPSLTFSKIVRTPIFWGIIVVVIFITMAVQGFNTQGVLFFSTIGLDMVQASFAFALVSLIGIPVGLLFGILCDKVGVKITALIYTALAALVLLATALWVGWVGSVIIAIGIAAAGAVSGMYGPMMAPRLFGAKDAASMIGFTTIGSSIGAMVGPIISGFLYTATGSYTLALVILGAFMVASLVLMIWVGSKKAAERIKTQIEAQAK